MAKKSSKPMRGRKHPGGIGRGKGKGRDPAKKQNKKSDVWGKRRTSKEKTDRSAYLKEKTKERRLAREEKRVAISKKEKAKKENRTTVFQRTNKKFGKGVCVLFVKGRCDRGDECEFSHTIRTRSAALKHKKRLAGARKLCPRMIVFGLCDKLATCRYSHLKAKLRKQRALEAHAKKQGIDTNILDGIAVKTLRKRKELMDKKLSKRTPEQVLLDRKKEPCKLFAKNECNKAKCGYSHDSSIIQKYQRNTLCTDYNKNKCILRSKCPFFHDEVTHARYVKSHKICGTLRIKGACSKGSKCKFSHRLPSKKIICADFLAGKCTKEESSCKFAHKIEEHCPEYLKLGVCKTRSTCTLIHNVVAYRKQQKATMEALKEAAQCSKYLKLGYCRMKDCPLEHDEKYRARFLKKQQLQNRLQRKLGKAAKPKHIAEERSKKICPQWRIPGRSTCKFGDKCKFAHMTKEELKEANKKIHTPPPLEKGKRLTKKQWLKRRFDKPCKFWAAGKCELGDRCKMSHDGPGAALPPLTFLKLRPSKRKLEAAAKRKVLKQQDAKELRAKKTTLEKAKR
eukprot:NODE_297_length_2723_cov_109.595385_g281_i0.p1 GENE.NODE_297_length_2723_cov_109.595385_g281_i0~~NODE_297_length_2723_cov_109.595385_g281_i0.p1  ORF type:complete len:590 (-),score=112.34 NODE_297_length_2723_cov_109.595385_g281_i0:954-2651(-)